MREISWRREKIELYGRELWQPRLIYFMSDDGVSYTYSRKKYIGAPWNQKVCELKKLVEEKTNTKFNSCLLNYYRDGQDSMGWHSDDEPELGKDPIVVALSFGGDRDISFRKKGETKTFKKLLLKNRSLLLMPKGFQGQYEHAISKRVNAKARISLTFRNIFSI